jgi:hypothetical protein
MRPHTNEIILIMETPYLVASDNIRTDGIYYIILHGTPPSSDYVNNNSYVFHGLTVKREQLVITYFESIAKDDLLIKKYGLTGVFKRFMEEIKRAEGLKRPNIYQVTYNVHNIVAKSVFVDDEYDAFNNEETIVCSLYKANDVQRLRVETFTKYFGDNSVHEGKDDYYDFMSFEQIEAGIPEAVENSLFPIRKKRKWWEF